MQVAVNDRVIERSAARNPSRSLVRSVLPAVERHPVLFIFLVALAVRVLVIATIGLFPDSYVFAVDNTTYSGMATAVVTGAAEKWDEGTRGLYNATFTFMGPVSLIYYLTDSSEVAAELFVAVLGAGAAALVTRLGMEFLPRGYAIAAGLFVALLPSQVLWSSLLLKDAAVWFVAAAIGTAIAIAGRKTGPQMIPWLLMAAIFLLGLAYLRAHTTVVAAWALGLAGFAGIATQRLMRGALMLVVAVAVPWVAGLGPAGYSFAAGAGSLEYRRAANALGAQSAFVEALSPEELSGEPAAEVAQIQAEVTEIEQKIAHIKGTAEQVPPDNPDHDAAKKRLARLKQQRRALLAERDRAVRLHKRAEVAGPAAPSEDEGLNPNLAHLPKGLSVMLFEPVPWSGGTSPTFQLARGEALLWYPLLGLAVVGLWHSRRHLRSLAFPLLAGGGILLVYALAEGNIGTAFRHRGELVWVVALLAALGLKEANAWRRRHADVSSTTPAR